VAQRYLRAGLSLYTRLAELLAGVGARRILDIGCGEGALRAALPVPLQSRAVGLDASWTMLGAHPRPVVQAHAEAFEEIQVERWDAPLVRLPDRDAVRDYLTARLVPPELATDAAGRITTPVTITRRGALIKARKAE
jgi:SAM-dependent methyltransferase